MRDYGKIGPKFWIGATGKRLRKAGVNAQVVAMYLLTSPHANMLGLYYQPKLFIAYETGLNMEGALEGLASCIEAGFCEYDEETEMVWVRKMAQYQIAESLSAQDNQCKGIQRAYDALPGNPFLARFFMFYQAAFHMTRMRGVLVETVTQDEGPLKPLASQEQEQEIEQDKEKKDLSAYANVPDVDSVPGGTEQQDSTALASVIPPGHAAVAVPNAVDEIFSYWQKKMDSSRSKLDDKRRKVITAALKMGYTPAQLCRAIRGCSQTPHNMGKNDQGQKYNGIQLIFRNADQIDRFIQNDITPPVSVGAGGRPTEGVEAARQSINEEAKRLLFPTPAAGVQVGGFDA